MKLAPIAIAFLIAAFVSTAFAQGTTSTPRIDQRQENQQRRIDKGTASGQLNEREAARMQKGQDHVNKMEERAMKDGKMTRNEKKRVEHAQDAQSARIYKQKHDKQQAK